MTADRVKIDVFVESDGQEYYFDLKTPSPNADQPHVLKAHLMTVRALRLPRDVDARAVFYYNPRGLVAPYNQGQVYLDYLHHEVLVGKAYWDFLGGPGTYEEVIQTFL